MKKYLLSLLFALCTSLAFAVTDINSATVQQLETVKGIGPAKAKAIVEYRSKNGAFKSLDDLQKVDGIGKKSLDKMRSELSVGGRAAPSTPAAATKPAAAKPKTP